MMARAPILIFFLRALRATAFWLLPVPWTAGGLWSKPQADQLIIFGSTDKSEQSTAWKRPAQSTTYPLYSFRIELLFGFLIGFCAIYVTQPKMGRSNFFV
jgi:hypothetical protein